MYRVIDSVDDHYNLQRDLTSLENWSDTWQMKFNPAKCVHLAITNKKIILRTVTIKTSNKLHQPSI